jgi:hypothetical protein
LEALGGVAVQNKPGEITHVPKRTDSENLGQITHVPNSTSVEHHGSPDELNVLVTMGDEVDYRDNAYGHYCHEGRGVVSRIRRVSTGESVAAVPVGGGTKDFVLVVSSGDGGLEEAKVWSDQIIVVNPTGKLVSGKPGEITRAR